MGNERLMKKSYVRIQGSQVSVLMKAIRDAGIPFVVSNHSRHSGSRVTIRFWDDERSDLLIALIRDSDRALIPLLNATTCRVMTDYIGHRGDQRYLWWR